MKAQTLGSNGESPSNLLDRFCDRPRSGERSHGSRKRRRGLALMLALFVMAVTSMIIITIFDTQTLQYTALRNTVDYDRARYLAEAGIQHALSTLEIDFDQGAAGGFTIPPVQFPAASGNVYQATIGPLEEDGTRTVSAQGTAGTFTRRLEIVIKMGG
jgi:Tfp pilus assembly protein PilX